MSFYIIVFILLAIVGFSYLNSLIPLGQIGEEKTVNRLIISKLSGKHGIILDNVYVPKPNGETSEIDVLFITQKGIFVIESKNYSGYIFGDEDDQKWTVTLYKGKSFWHNNVEKHQFYNPIKQNNTHIKYLDKYLGNNYKYYSIIAFSERCELKSVPQNREDMYICHRNDINQYISYIWDKTPDLLTESEISYIANKLENTGADAETKIKHIEQTKTKYESREVCPICGGKLVLRTARKGSNAGNRFYGCSNFPKCRYTKQLAD